MARGRPRSRGNNAVREAFYDGDSLETSKQGNAPGGRVGRGCCGDLIHLCNLIMGGG